MKLQKGDIVVPKKANAATRGLLFYVDGRLESGSPRLVRVSSRSPWLLSIPEDELDVVGHSGHNFKRNGSMFSPDEMYHFAPAIKEAVRRGYPINPELVA